MVQNKNENENDNKMLLVVETACKLPGVKINREQFLREQFTNCFPDMIEDIVSTSPRAAGVSAEAIEKAAKKCIDYESTKVTAISAAAGLPGGFAMLGTIPADLAQFYGHVFRVMQKLMYLYGWDDIGGMDDGTKNILIIFLGVMCGVEGAVNAVKKIVVVAQGKVAKAVAAKALTKGTLYPVVKKIATSLGIRMTKSVFAKGVAKAVPLVGAVVNGGLTYVTFVPMSKKLHKALKENQL